MNKQVDPGRNDVESATLAEPVLYEGEPVATGLNLLPAPLVLPEKSPVGVRWRLTGFQRTFARYRTSREE